MPKNTPDSDLANTRAQELRKAIQHADLASINKLLDAQTTKTKYSFRGLAPVQVTEEVTIAAPINLVNYDDTPDDMPLLYAIKMALENSEDEHNREDVISMVLELYHSEMETLSEKWSGAILKMLLDAADGSPEKERVRKLLITKLLELKYDLPYDHQNHPLLRVNSTNTEEGDVQIPFFWAVALQGDVFFFQKLISTEDTDGYVLDINKIFYGQTLLDALLIKLGEKETASLKAILNFVHIAEGLSFQELTTLSDNAKEKLKQQRCEEAHPQYRQYKEEHGLIDNEPLSFSQDTQNAHNAALGDSVKASAIRLYNRYRHNPSPENTLPDIRDFLRTLPESTEKTQALACFERICRTETQHLGALNATLSQLLTWVWHGIHDKNALTEGMAETLSDADVDARKHTLVRHLCEIQTEMPDGSDLCFSGTFNQIIAVLNHAHPDVMLAQGTGSLATVLSIEARKRLGEALRREPNFKQRLILTGWAQDPETPGYSSEAQEAADTFFKMVIQGLQSTFRRQYAHSIAAGPLEEIVSSLVDLDRPIVHSKLDALIETIQSITPWKTNAPSLVIENTLLHTLKSNADNAYSPRFDYEDFDNTYERLKENYYSYLKLSLKHLIDTIEAFDAPEDEAVQPLFDALKAKVQDVQAETADASEPELGNIESIHNTLEKAYSHFLACCTLSPFIQAIDKTDSPTPTPKSKEALTALKEKAREAWSKANTSSDESAVKDIYKTLVSDSLSTYEALEKKGTDLPEHIALHRLIQTIQKISAPRGRAEEWMFEDLKRQAAHAYHAFSDTSFEQKHNDLLTAYHAYYQALLKKLIQTINETNDDDAKTQPLLTALQKEAHRVNEVLASGDNSGNAVTAYQALSEQHRRYSLRRSLNRLIKNINEEEAPAHPKTQQMLSALRKKAETDNSEKETLEIPALQKTHDTLWREYDTFVKKCLFLLVDTIQQIEEPTNTNAKQRLTALKEKANKVSQKTYRRIGDGDYNYRTLRRAYQAFLGEYFSPLICIIKDIENPTNTQAQQLLTALREKARTANERAQTQPGKIGVIYNDLEEAHQQFLTCSKLLTLIDTIEGLPLPTDTHQLNQKMALETLREKATKSRTDLETYPHTVGSIYKELETAHQKFLAYKKLRLFLQTIFKIEEPENREAFDAWVTLRQIARRTSWKTTHSSSISYLNLEYQHLQKSHNIFLARRKLFTLTDTLQKIEPPSNEEAQQALVALKRKARTANKNAPHCSDASAIDALYQDLKKAHETFLKERVALLAQTIDDIKSVNADETQALEALKEEARKANTHAQPCSEANAIDALYQDLKKAHETFLKARVNFLIQTIEQIEPPTNTQAQEALRALKTRTQGVSAYLKLRPNAKIIDEYYQNLKKQYELFQAHNRVFTLTDTIQSLGTPNCKQAQGILEELKEKARKAGEDTQVCSDISDIEKIEQHLQSAKEAYPRATLAQRILSRLSDKNPLTLSKRQQAALNPLVTLARNHTVLCSDRPLLAYNDFVEKAKEKYRTFLTQHEQSGALGMFGAWKAGNQLVRELDTYFHLQAQANPQSDTIFRFVLQLMLQVFQKLLQAFKPAPPQKPSGQPGPAPSS